MKKKKNERKRALIDGLGWCLRADRRRALRISTFVPICVETSRIENRQNYWLMLAIVPR